MVIEILSAGDTAFAVQFGSGIDRAVNARVMALHARIAAARAKGELAGLTETVPTFRSLLVQYDPLIATRAELEPAVRALAEAAHDHAALGRRWRIPVCYRGDFAPDLQEVARRCKLAAEAVVALHTGTVFFAYMLGFLPGFAYLGGLPKQLSLPRRSQPRLRVPQGSVSIAGEMAAIYPWESPGGWHLIGRTPIALFDLRRAQPILWAAGDEAQFHAIGRADYDVIAAQVAAGNYDHAALEVKR